MLLALTILSLLIWLVLLTGRGRFWQPERLPVAPEPAVWPEVVAIVPARNEANGVGVCITSLLAQDYPGKFRVVLVNDHSEDDTVAEARSVAEEFNAAERIQILDAEPLPEGWAGKVWAMHQGIERGLEDEQPAYLWLTDADISHAPETLRDLVSQAEAEQLALNSRMVMLVCQSGWERLMIPAFVHFFRMLYPFRRVNNPADKLAGGAGGCMLVNREKLAATGGLKAMRGAIIDDCTLAAQLKAIGPIRLHLTNTSHSLRGYDGLDGILRMIRRTAYTQLGYSKWQLAGCVLGMALVFLMPLFGVLLMPWPLVLVPLATYIILGGSYVPMLRFYGRSPLWALLLPVVALLYLQATIQSAQAYHAGKGGQWKGRAQA